MARPWRVEQTGACYHISSRGIDRKPIFRDDVDRRHWLELLAQAVDTYRLIIAVSTAIKRMALRLEKEKHLPRILHKVEKQILNVET